MAGSGSKTIPPLLVEKHLNFLVNCAPEEGSLEQLMSEHLKMSGIYWCLTAVNLLNDKDYAAAHRAEILDFVKKCQHPCGGFGSSVGHDPHLLHTLSAIQILTMLDALEEEAVDIPKVVSFIQSLQQADGSFFGDKWGEVDVRFSFGALGTLALLNKLNAVNVEKAVEFVMQCNNLIDGGFGSRPGSESHSGLVYCALGSLALTGHLDKIDADLLGWWLCERQVPSGGLNGRPEKLPDLCYSWWVLASLQMIGRLHWIDRSKLTEYILNCQDQETGGFSDRPGNMVDPFHTLFGITGISLLTHFYQPRSGEGNSDPPEPLDFEACKELIGLVNPVLCMPEAIISKRKVRMQLLSL